MPRDKAPAAATGREALELPAQGYPPSAEAVDDWFRKQHGRAPTDQEVGAIIGAMAQREATSPRSGPPGATDGWVTGPTAAPATRR
jgi:hypothetical protein